MQVIFLNDFGSIRGGADEVAISEAQGLAEAGHRVTFVIGSGGALDPRLKHPLIEAVCLDQPDVSEINTSPVSIIRGWWNAEAGKRVAGLLRPQAKASLVVHVHGWTKALTNAALRAVVKSKAPTVLTMHNYFSVCPNGAFYEFPKQVPCHRSPMGIACLSASCDQRSQIHKQWRAVRQVLLHAGVPWPKVLKTAIAVSKFSAERMRPWLPSACRIHVLPNPIDISQQRRVEAARNREFLFVGRLSAEKGVLDFAAATKMAGVPAVFVGAGDMERAIKAENSQAEITGWLDRAGVNARLGQARALVFPSRWWETQGMAVPQAMARGVPVVVASTTGAAELVTHGRNGWCFEAGDRLGLSEILTRLCDDGLVGRVGTAAFDDFWKGSFGLAQHTEALERIYEEALWAP